jgi:hypothetical protein
MLAEKADRKLRWAANFFIWTAIISLVISVFLVYDRYLQSHSSSFLTVAGFIGYMAGGILRNSWLEILILINALILRRYKSRISATLFIPLGLWGLWIGISFLSHGVLPPFSLMSTLLSGAYLFIAVWSLVALIRRHRELSKASA